MAKLVVETAGRKIELAPGDELTFGRDRTCDVSLDTSDVGISRVAGRIGHEDHAWAVVNLSRKRALHVVDQSGFAVPLPVATAAGPASRRLVDQQVLTILIAGERSTHALILKLPKQPAPAPSVAPPVDPVSTRSQAPKLTDRQREVLVALAQGYLRRYPDYDPRPLTYQQVADQLGLTKRQVMKRVERVRDELVAAHVPGLEGEIDARRPLCEWLLATRIITPSDLDWLQPRIQRARVTRPLTRLPEAARPSAVRGDPFPTTTHPAHDTVTRIAERTARQVAPALHSRLHERYGDRWLQVVNDRRRRENLPTGSGLGDYRFCLAVLAHDPASEGWVDDRCRISARELGTLANAAVHRRRLRPADVDRAGDLARTIAKCFPPEAGDHRVD
jgi:hypothetical protein